MSTNAFLIRVHIDTPQLPSGVPVTAGLVKQLKEQTKKGDLAFVSYGKAESFKGFHPYRIMGAPGQSSELKVQRTSLKWLLPVEPTCESDQFDIVNLTQALQSLSKDWAMAPVKVKIIRKPNQLVIAEKKIYKRKGWSEESLGSVYSPETQTFDGIPDVIGRIPWDVLQKGMEIRIKNDVSELDQLEKLVFSKSVDQLDRISGRQFEMLCRRLIASLNFRVTQTLGSHDDGVDLLAVESAPLRRRELYVIQCKRQTASVGVGPIRELDSVVGHHGAILGIFITNNVYSRPAKEWAQGKPLDLIDGFQLRSLINQHDISIAR